MTRASSRRWLSDEEYAAFYLSPEWRARKDRYEDRHPKQCKACGSTASVQLHHLTYRWPLGYEPDEALMWLCRRDHQRVKTWQWWGFSLRTSTSLVVVFGRLGL